MNWFKLKIAPSPEHKIKKAAIEAWKKFLNKNNGKVPSYGSFMINDFIEVNYSPLLFIVVAEQKEYKLDSIDFRMIEAALERERSKLRQTQAAETINKYL